MGTCKVSELSMTDEELHLLVSAHTGKDSIKALNKRTWNNGQRSSEYEGLIIQGNQEQTETDWKRRYRESAEENL